MASNPYDAPQQPNPVGPTGEQPSPLPLILGIVSIVVAVLSFFPGCCCSYFALIPTLGSIAAGVGGLMTADENNSGARITSIIGIVLGVIVLLLYIVLFSLAAMGSFNIEDLQQFENQ